MLVNGVQVVEFIKIAVVIPIENMSFIDATAIDTMHDKCTRLIFLNDTFALTWRWMIYTSLCMSILLVFGTPLPQANQSITT